MDIELTSTLNGFDVIVKNNDFSIINGFQNMPLLSMFGGNVEQSTKDFKPKELRYDFWGNELFLNKNRVSQFNSLTEKALNEIPLTSNGRLLIEESIKSDLKYLIDFAEIKVSTYIEQIDRIKIIVQINEPNSSKKDEFVYIWNATKQELLNGNNS